MKPAQLALAAILSALVATPTPAWALFCANEGPVAPKTYVEEDGRSVLRTDDELQQRIDTQRLREIGVPARSVERWNGCLRAFVETASGGQIMEFYDPVTLRRVQ
ncbi:MAG: hypothetical protein JWP99_347 [Devosia sp.]|nr:hypothetical protein [Devosia sp.]